MGANRVTAVVWLLLFCAACHRQGAAGPTAGDEPVGFSTDASVDPGGAMLAGVDNARGAIARGDALAANNDLAQALAYAVQLPGASSRLFPDQAPTRAGATSLMLPRFTAQVRLQSADTDLQSGDLKDADADLAAIQAGVPARLVPSNLPLIEAAQSLTLAKAAVGSNRPSDLTLQLNTARAALASDTRGPHSADAKALAAEIGRELDAAGGAAQIQTGQLTLWATKVNGWV